MDSLQPRMTLRRIEKSVWWEMKNCTKNCAPLCFFIFRFRFFVHNKKTPWMEFGLADREEVCCVTAMVLSEWEIDMNWRSVVLWHTSLWCSSLLAPCALPVKTCVVVVCRHSVWSGVSRWFLPSLSSTNLLQAHDVAEVQWGGTHINIQHSFTHTLIKV